MSHLDEGTLHALLDGELDLHEVKEIQAHIGSCAACGTRLREVKEFHGESDRLVGLMEMPTGPSRRTGMSREDDPDPVEVRAAAPAPPAPPRRQQRVSGPAAEPPPLLLPENPDYGRSKVIRRMRWAALLFVTVGAGYIGSQMRQSGVTFVAPVLMSPSDSISDPDAVLSSEEAIPAEDAGSTKVAPAQPEERDRAAESKAAAPPPASKPATPLQARSATPAPQQARRNTAVVGAASANETPADSESADGESADTEAQAAGVRSANYDDSAAAEEEPAVDEGAPPAERENVRAEAAEALRQLDRERTVERADAATAALDSIRRVEAARARQAAAAPAPRTAQQRAQVYLRIGLDEAAKQLGRPVHVIEGMSPLFMGLAQGRFSPGADATRPVVRVVYQDAQERLILLDQQRVRPGQSTSSQGNGPHWVTGEIALHLSGEVSADVLRNYRARVR